MFLLLLHHIVGKEVPEVEADLKKFFIWDPTHLSKVSHSLKSGISQHLNFLVWLNTSSDLLDKVEIVLQD